MLSATASAATAHPSTAYVAQPVAPRHLTAGDRPQEAWQNGLSFRPCEKHAGELSSAERYILRGLQPTHGGSGQPEAWKTKILMFAHAYCSRYGSVPPELSPETLEQIGMGGSGFEERVAWHKSPISGDFPRFDSQDFTPGGVYLRVLSADEVHFQAQWDSNLAGLVTVGKSIGSEAGSKQDALLLNPVLYYRFYGESGLLSEGISYIFAPRH